MAVERLQFSDGDARYHSYLAAQHVVRYAVVRDIVAGKRVLDIACGEGYGSRMLQLWGAGSVLGVDNSPDAIANAKKYFGGNGTSFLVGDAENVADVLKDVEPFDVIVSLETIEHLRNPSSFLSALKNLISGAGAIVISCPNDFALTEEGESNPFHIRKFTLSDFQSLTEKHLGKAAQWLLGAPLLGEMNFVQGDEFVEVPEENPIAITRNKAVSNTLSIPAQHNLATNADTCSHYIGVWGTRVPANAVISTLSVPEYQGIWKHRAFLETELARVKEINEQVLGPKIEQLEGKVAQLDTALQKGSDASDVLTSERDSLIARISTGLEPELARQTNKANQAAAKLEALAEASDALKKRQNELQLLMATTAAARDALAKRIANELEPAVSRLKAGCADAEAAIADLTEGSLRLTAERNELQASLVTSQRDNSSLAKRIADELEPEIMRLKADKLERLEPEIARLRTHVEHSKFEKETQVLRQRIMYYAESDRRLGNQIGELRRQLGEESRLRETWFVPELTRLQTGIADLWKTKTEWFDPQLEQRAARIAQLEADVARLNNEASNVLPVRIMRATIREARRIAGAIRRRLNR